MTASGPATRPADLVLVCPHLGDGGAQRVVSVLARLANNRGRRVSVVTLYDEDPVYELEPGVAVLSVPDYPLMRQLENARHVYVRIRAVLSRFGPPRQTGRGGLLGVIKRILSPLGASKYLAIYARVRVLRSILRDTRAGTVISFCGSTNVTTILAARGLDCRTIISERNDPALQKLKYPWEHLRRRHYNGAQIVTANTRGALETMRAYADAEKLVYVPNPLFRPCDSPSLPDPGRPEAPTVLTVGRLHHQKAQDVLLEAFARLSDDMDAWTLAVVGQGEAEQALRQQSVALGIEARVRWHGQVRDPFPFYRRAQIFALPSRHEGAPNSLLEAMSCGMAVIVSDASPGPLEIVEDGENGIVVPVGDADALARGIARLAADPGLRRALGRRAAETVASYDAQALAAWNRVLEPERIGDGILTFT